MKRISILILLLYSCAAIAQDTSCAQYNISLGEVDVNSSSNPAREIVKKAFARTAKNLAPYSMRSNYTEYISENGEQRRSLKAVVIVEDDAKNRSLLNCAEDAYIIEGSKSGGNLCFVEPAKANHMDEMLVWNPIRYPQFLGNLNKLSCRIDSMIPYDSAFVYVISYGSKGRHRGTLYIDTASYYILKCTNIVSRSEKGIPLKDDRTIQWNERSITVTYKHRQGKLYPALFSYSLGIDLLSDNKVYCAFVVRTELSFIEPEPVKDGLLKMDKGKDLYLQVE